MKSNKQIYTFGWDEFLTYCDPDQKYYEGTELSVFVKEWNVDFEVLVLWTYQQALDYGRPPSGARWCATRGAMRDLDVRSWDRFHEVKSRVEEILATYTPERGEEAAYIFSWHLAQHSHFRRIPKRFQHHFLDS